jgi:ribose 5-phosphate isomerase B
MKVYLGADHGGYEMKEVIKKWLLENHYEVEDCGAFSFDAEDDYPDFTFPAAEKVAQDSTGQVRGILSCRSSGGAVIAANKVKGIRAVSVFDVKSAKYDWHLWRLVYRGASKTNCSSLCHNVFPWRNQTYASDSKNC